MEKTFGVLVYHVYLQIFERFNPLTAGVAYIRVFNNLNMLKIKCDIKQKDFKRVNLNNFHSLEVVDRVSETQLQVGENSS